ncbi:MAG: hypothetical protein AB1921_09220 [Thermodesulfobacteriota bacterium]
MKQGGTGGGSCVRMKKVNSVTPGRVTRFVAVSKLAPATLV